MDTWCSLPVFLFELVIRTLFDYHPRGENHHSNIDIIMQQLAESYRIKMTLASIVQEYFKILENYFFLARK